MALALLFFRVLIASCALALSVSKASDCTIPVRDITDLVEEDFLKPMLIRAEPATLKAARALGGNVDASASCRGSILDDTDVLSAKVPIGEPQELATSGKGGKQVKLQMLARDDDDADDGTEELKQGDAGPILFDRDGSLQRTLEKSERWSQALGEAQATFSAKPDSPGDMLYSKWGNTSWIFSVGLKGRGIPWHFHVQSFQALMCGKKRWAVAPPGTPLHFDSSQSQLRWRKRNPPKKRHSKVAECTQHPGEVVFVPAGWPHATTTLSERSFSLGRQDWENSRPRPLDGSDEWHHAFDQCELAENGFEWENAEYMCQRAAELNPAEWQVQWRLARVRLRKCDDCAKEVVQKSLEALQAAHKLNPLQTEVVTAIEQTLHFLGRNGKAETLHKEL